VNYLKKWFFTLLVVCVMLAPISAMAAGNESSKAQTQTLPVNLLEIDSDVTAFSDFTVSDTMRKLSGSINLNGNVPDAENKMRPVYKFKLENKTMDTLSNLTVNIPYPPGTQLDTTYPPEVLITETNKNRNKEDIIADYDTTTGIKLTLPDMEKDEILTFDVKFFLLPLENDEKEPVIDLHKVKIKPEAKVVEWFKEDAKVRLKLMMHNSNSIMMEKVMLKLKLPEGIDIQDAMITGIEGATVTIKDGYAIIYLPKMVKGDSNIVLHFNMKKIQGWDKLHLPLMIGMDGMTDVSLTPLTFTLKDMPEIDWTKIIAKGDFMAEMKKGKLCLDYKLNIDNKNTAAAKTYKLRLLLPKSVKIEDLKVSGLEGAKIEVDTEGVIWIIIPSLNAGMSNLHVSLTGTYTGSASDLLTDILTEGSNGVTATLSTTVKGMTSTDSDTTEVITVEKPTNASGGSGNTLPETGSPFSQLTWSMLGSLFVLLGIGLYVKAARMQA
jgi:hypothetical protein